MRRAARAGVAALLAASCAGAQEPAPPVALGFGVDTAAADVGAIVRLVRAYLARPDGTAAERGLWSTAHPRDRRSGDLARGAAYQGFPATIVGVVSAGPGDSAYVVKVLHARGDRTGAARPLALHRMLALREPDAPHGWRLGNVLPRHTRHWERRTVGGAAFWYAPGQRPNDARIAEAVRFVDSVAAAFAVPAPASLDVYVAGSIDEAHAVIGLDFYVLPSGPGSGRGGRALAPDGIVLVGDPAIGEAYRHELVHAVLGPTLGGGTALWIEGVATWLGGSLGRTPREAWALLHRYQQRRPEVTVAAIVGGDAVPGGWGQPETDALYATGALVVDAVWRRGGMDALRRLAAVRGDGPAALDAAQRLLGLADRAALDRWWRAAAAEAAARGGALTAPRAGPPARR